MLNIEKLTKEDIDEVLEISTKQFGVNGWQVELFKEELNSENHYSFVAKLDNLVVAFLFVMKTEGERGEEFNILNIATRKGFENQGIATEMFNFLIKFAKEFDIFNFWLEVRESNTNAIKLYQNLGFKVDYIRKSYYLNGEHALIMSLEAR